MWLDQVSDILLPLQWKGDKPNKDIWNINVLKLIYVNKYKFLEINSFFPKAGPYIILSYFNPRWNTLGLIQKKLHMQLI